MGYGYGITITEQVIIMFLMVAVGFLCEKTGIITLEATNVYCRFLLTIVMPATLINAYQQEYLPELMNNFWLAFSLSALFHIISILAASFLIHKKPDAPEPAVDDTPVKEPNPYRVERLAVVLSNAGFMGIPLLTATFGKEGVFYGSTYMGIFTVVSWTWGVACINGRKSVHIKKILFNPGVIAFIAGLLLFLLRITLPYQIGRAVQYIANLNTPLSMVFLGVYLSRGRILGIAKKFRVYYVSFCRNLALPLLFVLLIYLSGLTGWIPGSKIAVMSILVCASAPTAVSVMMLPANFGYSSKYASQLTCFTTLLSILTLPFIMTVAEWLLL